MIDAAIHRRPRRLGRDRRAHHRKPGPSRAGLGPLLPGRLQERHRRQCARSPSMRSSRLAAAPFPGRHQGRPIRRSPPPPATRTATSSCAAASAPNYDAASVEAACRELASRRPVARRVMIDASHANSRKKPENQPAVVARCRPPDRGRRDAHHRRDGREPPRRRPPGSRARPGRWSTARASPTAASAGRRASRCSNAWPAPWREGVKLPGRGRPCDFAAARGLIGPLALDASAEDKWKPAKASLRLDFGDEALDRREGSC